MFHKVDFSKTYIPASQALIDFIHELCPVDAHINVIPRGLWVNVDWSQFSNQYMSNVTTAARVVRATSYNGRTFWTVENWSHDNGYHCTLVELTKEEFLSLIKM